ncbi:uncharacterized protein LOC131681066 [Topomyia yanbarensis]|uniref:uncharacterized protein LOC131681066 n=1 Tax=Topomyia yanbarensis TaxID=2498891 RepID=UPI00273C0B13|nr:uncharacterized protein LOC131681066 [Topomyia yanbarensis]
MQNLCPLLAHEGLLRVGGRLRHSKLPFDVKHQWILPANNPVVRSLIKALHQENLHVGPSGLMAILRQQFWIPKCRNTIRLITRSCVRCFKVNPKALNQFMGYLPGCRLEKAPAFLKVGVDLAGPIMIRQGVRKAKGCVFICMVTKGIHLEAVENLSTVAFLATLQRFVSRRGVPEEIYSDNGTNFVGAKNELRELYEMFKKQMTEQKIFEFCQPKQTIPPYAPQFGGL